MAELALGLTKTVVEGALSRIQWAIEEEGKLKEGVQQDLEFITGEFQMMQSFLKVANKEHARKNEVVRTWVRQLRDLAFDVEDWVEFVAHLDKDKSLCSCWWRLVPSWAVPRRLAPPRHLDEAAAEMKLLKARVNDVSQRNTRYNLFNSDDSSSSSGLDSKSVVPAGSDLSSMAFHLLRQVWRDETDRLRNVGSLPKLITSEVVGADDLQVIWLWESDDRYASQLIHMAYQDEEICRSFKRRSWVKIMHPFNLQAFLNTLAAQLLFVGSSHHQATSDGLTSTAELIQQATKEQRYLVVLEHVSDFAEWNTIRMYLPDNKKGSRIVVSSQNLQHATLCTRVPYLVSELAWFPDGRPSICAFYKKVTGQSDSAMDTLIAKIKRGGVISVYGDGPKKSSVVKNTYLRILQNPEILDGARFGCVRWVPVVDDRRPFNPVDFSGRLLLSLDVYGFYDGDLQELFDIFGGSRLEKVLRRAKEEEWIGNSRTFLGQSENWLVVIDGLRSTKEWDDLVKSGTILHDMPTKCCVVVVTNDQSVARYCVDGNEDLLVHVSEEIHVGMPQGPILTCRREVAIDWMRSISDPHLRERRLLYDRLINNCMTVRSPPVVSVWGIPGVGKSTLVNWSYTKKMLDPENKHTFRYYCWVYVPHPFSQAELSLRLLRAFFSDYISHQVKERVMIAILEGDRDPIQECRLLLRQHMGWLLVLDDLRSTDEWDTINDAFCLSKPSPGSRTIVITNEQSVAMHCVDKNDKQVVSVQALKAGEALNLFKEKIRNKSLDKEPSDMERVSELSESIVTKCGGLPKVIASVAEHYNSMSSDKQTYLKLKDINDNFMHILEGLQSLKGLFSWMQYYLETCKDDLKPCIFYLPIFPVGHNIRLRRLLMRWIAEGYIRDISSRTAEKNIEMLFTELWEFSMFQVQQSSKPLKCRVNGFLHEYINSRPMEDNLVSALEGPCSMRSQRAGGQHLTIRDSWDRDMNVFGSTDFSRLRSLTVFGECRPFMFDPSKIKMRYVRVLDLEDAPVVTNDNLKHIVEVFPRLKFLSLRGCREITRLPKSLGSLRQLQALDVRDTSVAALPKAILKLQKLMYVRAGTIHSAPWDEGGIMVPYQTTRPEEIISTSVPAQDGTTFGAAPLALAEDAAATIAAAPSAPAEDATTAVATPLAEASEDITAIATAPLSLAEVATTVAAAPSAPEEDATTCTTAPSALEEDPTIVAAYPTTPAQGTTTVPAAPSAPAEDTTIVVADATALAEDDATIVAATLSTPAEDTTSLAAEPTAPVEDSTIVAAAKHATVFEVARSAPTEDVTTVAAAPPAPAEDRTMAATSPLAPVEDARTISPAQSHDTSMAAAEQGTTVVRVAPSALVEDTIVVADPTALKEDAALVAPTLSTSAEDTTSLATDPTAAVEDTIIVAPVPLTLAEDATIVAVARSALTEDATRVAAAPTALAEDSSMAAAAPRRPHALVHSWLSKLGCRSQGRLDNTNHGVEVPAGFGKLTTLDTFGVATVGHGNKSVILKELHKLTQLKRLSVCGINLDNIRQFFSAIAGLNNLGNLSVRLYKNRDGLFPSLDDTIPPPPKTLEEILKLQGHVRILQSSWIKEFANVETLDLEVTLQEQDDMQVILDHLIHRTKGSLNRLCIKPIQDGELRIGINDERKFVGLELDVLEIVCTTNLQATIGNIGGVEVLRVECSSGSSLQLSGLQGIRSLEEVWLKGSCSDALKEDLQGQLDQRQDKDKPVLKVLQTLSS